MAEELWKRPFSRLLFLWLTGILLQYYWPDAFGWSYLLLAFAIISMGASACTGEKYSFAYRWVWGAGFSCLLLFISIQVAGYKAWLTEWNPPPAATHAQLRLASPVTEKGKSVFCFADLVSYKQDDSLVVARKKVGVYFEKDTSAVHLQQGDELIVYARFRPLAALPHEGFYTAYLYNNRISATAYVPSGNWQLVPFSGSGSGPDALARYRSRLLGRFEQLALEEDEKTVLAAIAFGYTAKMDKEIRTRFSSVGAAHLLAVSGFHVAVVAGFISFFLCWLPRSFPGSFLKYGSTFVLIWLFVLLTGMAVSAVRAACMFSFYLAGRWLGRSSDGYNTLAAAAFFILVFDPYALFDIGFQLSFTAVFFILYLQPRLNGIFELRNPWVNYLWSGLTVTAAAQIGTAPLCMYAFGNFPLLFLFANLPLTMLATLLMPVTYMWIFTASWLPDGFFIQRVLEWLVRVFFKIAGLFSAVPGASISVSFGFIEMTISYLAIFSFLIYRKKKQPKGVLVSLGFVFLLLLLLYVRKNVVTGI